LARVTLVVQGTEGLEPLVAKDAQPLAQLGKTNPQQRSNFLTGPTSGDGQDGGESLVNPSIKRLLTQSFNGLPLLGGQENRFHGDRVPRSDASGGLTVDRDPFYASVLDRRRYTAGGSTPKSRIVKTGRKLYFASRSAPPS